MTDPSAAGSALPRARAMRSGSAVAPVARAVDPADLARSGRGGAPAVRMERGMSVSVLARRSMCARSTVQRLERGVLHPRPSLLGWIAYCLDPDNSKLIRPVKGHPGGGHGGARGTRLTAGGEGGARAGETTR